ncbi:hypothetical protein B0H12DRAFT_1129906 [Mycena haematopus]|nr:hypothetical protein B0H12DRAFT_1129906 [Mycena haematopus]
MLGAISCTRGLRSLPAENLCIKPTGAGSISPASVPSSDSCDAAPPRPRPAAHPHPRPRQTHQLHPRRHLPVRRVQPLRPGLPVHPNDLPPGVDGPGVQRHLHDNEQPYQRLLYRLRSLRLPRRHLRHPLHPRRLPRRRLLDAPLPAQRLHPPRIRPHCPLLCAAHPAHRPLRPVRDHRSRLHRLYRRVRAPHPPQHRRPRRHRPRRPRIPLPHALPRPLPRTAAQHPPELEPEPAVPVFGGAEGQLGFRARR